jgi:hypothetical protein
MEDAMIICGDFHLSAAPRSFLLESSASSLPACAQDYFAVFDGHAGAAAAEFAASTLHLCLWNELNARYDDGVAEADATALPSNERVVAALRAAFHTCQRLLKEVQSPAPITSGAAALVALFVGDDLFVANAGDARAVYGEFSVWLAPREAGDTDVEGDEDNDNGGTSTIVEHTWRGSVQRVLRLSVDHKPDLPEEEVRDKDKI